MQRVSMTVSMPQGGSVTVAAHGFAQCRSATRRSTQHRADAGRPTGCRSRRSASTTASSATHAAMPTTIDGGHSRLERSRLRLLHKWWTRRLVACAVIYYGKTLRRWMRSQLPAVRAKLAARAAAAANADAMMPAASTLGSRSCSETDATAPPPAQRLRLADTASLPPSAADTPIPTPTPSQLPSPRLEPRSPFSFSHPPLPLVVPAALPGFSFSDPPSNGFSFRAPAALRAPPMPPLLDDDDPDFIVVVTGPNGSPQPDHVVESAVKEHTGLLWPELKQLMVTSGRSYATVTVAERYWTAVMPFGIAEDVVHTAVLPRWKRRPPLTLRIALANTGAWNQLLANLPASRACA